MRTQYNKYHEKMKRLIDSECNMGNFSFVDDCAFDDYGKYFLKTVKKDGEFKLYRYITLHYYDEKTHQTNFNLDLNSIYLTQNGSQNDVFEGLPQSYYDTYSQEECLKSLQNIAYLKCFSETYDNNLMWSHYADSYRGVCIEYDIAKLSDENTIKQLFPVYYSKSREVFYDMEILNDYMRGVRDMKRLEDSKGIFLSKADHWKYEREWRICQMNDEANNETAKQIPFDCVSAVYLGIRTSNMISKM